jgi:hypothetical protein
MLGILRRASRALALLGLSTAICLTTGCKKGIETRELSPEEVHFYKFARLMRAYKDANHKPAMDAKELKTWAKKQPKEEQEKWEIDDLEKAFISPRDNLPYVIVPLPMGMGPLHAHEEKGADGKRLVLNGAGSVILADEEQFASLQRGTPGHLTGDMGFPAAAAMKAKAGGKGASTAKSKSGSQPPK